MPFLKFAEQKSNAVSNSDTKTAGTKIGSIFYGDQITVCNSREHFDLIQYPENKTILLQEELSNKPALYGEYKTRQ